MNHIRQRIELSDEILESKVPIKSKQQHKNNTINKYQTAVILILLAAWVILSVTHNGIFMTEAIISSLIITGLLFMRIYYDPKNINEKHNY
jgi:hypothetical protein